MWRRRTVRLQRAQEVRGRGGGGCDEGRGPQGAQRGPGVRGQQRPRQRLSTPRAPGASLGRICTLPREAGSPGLALARRWRLLWGHGGLGGLATRETGPLCPRLSRAGRSRRRAEWRRGGCGGGKGPPGPGRGRLTPDAPRIPACSGGLGGSSRDSRWDQRRSGCWCLWCNRGGCGDRANPFGVGRWGGVGAELLCTWMESRYLGLFNQLACGRASPASTCPTVTEL